AWEWPKNKPNSNPIQSQFNPKQTQFNPKQTQFVERAKINAFAWIRSFTMVYYDFLADFTTLRVPILKTAESFICDRRTLCLPQQ
ncbi:MAG: hypothetical protein RQ760_01825, partial [Sedimentisphaerales bacterium]|nr:hypothetical protein [Sedimentisphaerales bacterium]